MSEFIENVRAVGAAAREDHREASLRDRAAFYVTSLGLAAHQVGMEAALFAAGTSSYLWAHDNIGVAAAAPFVAAAANGLVSYGVESSLVRGTARGFKTFNGATTEIADRFIRPDAVDEKTAELLETSRQDERSFKDKANTAVLALALGSPVTVMESYAQHPNEPIEKHKRVGLRIARSLGIFNAGVGLIVGAGIYASEELGTDAVYNGVEAVSDSPITYAVFASLIGIRVLKTVTKRRKEQRAAANEADSEV